MAVFLSHDIKRVIRMEDMLQVAEQAFRDHSLGLASNLPRERLKVPKGVYRVMSGGIPSLGGMGTKAGLHDFSVPPGLKRSPDVTILYSTETGELLAVIWTGLITDYRTGAMGGVAAKYLARPGSQMVGMLGSGRQARAQLQAVALVRSIKRVLIYSPNSQHRKAYAEEMTQELNLEAIPVDSPRTVVEAADILIAATNSSDPVFDGDWLREGTHVISVRSSHELDIAIGRERREIDDRTVERSDFIAVDSREQAILQKSPELMGAIQQGRVTELGEVVAGRVPGRTNDRQITLFKSFGMGLQDVAAAAKVYELAVAQGLGLEIPEPED